MKKVCPIMTTIMTEQTFIGSFLNLDILYNTFLCLKSEFVKKLPHFYLNPFIIITFIPFLT